MAAMWMADSIDELQQMLWLTSVYMVEAGSNARGVIVTLEAHLSAMADHCDAEKSWLYRNRLAWHHKVQWRMVLKAEDMNRAHRAGKRIAPSDDLDHYDVIER